jgi:hypothetical protein
MSFRAILIFALFLTGGPIISLAPAPSPSTSPRELADDLARQGVPGGIVVLNSELADVSSLSSRRAPADALQSPDAGVSARVNQFNAVGSHYHATSGDGFVHVRSVREPDDLRLVLERDVHVDESSELSARDAVFMRVVKALSGKEPQAIIGTGGFPGPECPLGRPVHVPAGWTSVTRMLDDIVKQVPGLVWLVTYDFDAPDYGLEVGLLCGGGAAVRITVFP